MAIDLTLPRAAVERIMFGDDADRCTIHREPPDRTTFDPDTGDYEPPAPRLVYSGVCSLRSAMTSSAGSAEQGAVSAIQQRWTLKLPIVSGIAGPRKGDVVTMTTSRDPQWQDARFVVRDVGGGTNAVLRSLALDRWEPGRGADWMVPNP